MMKVHLPPNEQVIDEVFVGLSEDAGGLNGIVATMIPGVGGVPMVTASEKVLAVFKRQIDELAQMISTPIKIYRFTRAEVIATAEPRAD